MSIDCHVVLLAAGGGTVQIKPAPTPATPSSVVQNLKIIQGQGGQIQVQGLLPGTT